MCLQNSSTMVSFLHLLLALPLLIFFTLLLKKSIKKKLPLPPGPRGIPIIGNLHQLDSSNLHFQLWNFSKIYGPIFSLRMGFKRAIIISTPKLAQEILNDHDLDVCTRPMTLSQKMFSYNGIDMNFSPQWKEMRKIAAIHFFSAKKVSSFSHVRKSEVKKMIQKISGHVSSSKITNLSEIIMSVATAINCRILFGRTYEEDGAEKSRFHGILNEGQALFLTFFISDYIPFLGWIDKITGSLARLESTFNSFDVFFQQVLNDHQNPNRQKDADEGDVIDALLQLKKQGCPLIDLTDDQIKAILMDLLMGSIDTSVASSVWVMTGLIKNPRAMKKAQEEVRNLCGNKEFIDEDDIQKLEYFKAVIKEALRFYSPAPLLPREVNKSFIIDGYEIQSKTLVFVNLWAIHRYHEAWKDPEEFYPERFLDNNIDFKGRDFELIPFGAGRRICPGIQMGIATVEVIIANLLNSFDWEMPIGMIRENIDDEGLPGLARHKKNHLCLVAKNYM
ncbi:6,7,8-trihydroxycoumarin synthase-like [Lotus japonicus]|uniref:6,7,8-trihydroxycoumarin synthase-like n=1 Tax=Lotus japonicus TaxID=34305 RepID=UPI002582722D|nr:6,7,8-trihydroxycoumarin synthase-like [Lotus japonicus]